MGVTGWSCLPLSAALAAGVALLGARLGGRMLAALRLVAVALLLPGLALALWPPDPAWLGRSLSGPPPQLPVAFLGRTLGTLPLLALPILAVLHRMAPGQGRTAAGLGAGRLARLHLLWLPQLGPACLAGLLLAVVVDAASLRAGSRTATALSPPAAPP